MTQLIAHILLQIITVQIHCQIVLIVLFLQVLPHKKLRNVKLIKAQMEYSAHFNLD